MTEPDRANDIDEKDRSERSVKSRRWSDTAAPVRSPAEKPDDAAARDGDVDHVYSAAAAMAIAETRAWVERVVIGLDLCPFAKAVQVRGGARFVCTAAPTVDALLGALADEVQLLLQTPPRELETTLLIHPFVLADFDDYNDFLDLADAALEALGCSGVLQIASFHPQYRFEGTAAADIENATNRSPYPTLQLLREASVAAAATTFADSASIYDANIATLRSLGPRRWAALQNECRSDAARAVAANAEPR